MSRTKIKKLRRLRNILKNLKKKGKSIVFTNGCFDILHYGHLMYLEQAKAKGDILVVALNSDSSVKKIKGKQRPIINEYDRLRIIAGLASVDYVVLFSEDNPLRTIKFLKPDVLVKGADWSKKDIVGADFVKSYGGRVFTIKLAKGRSTSKLIRKIIEAHQNR